MFIQVFVPKVFCSEGSLFQKVSPKDFSSITVYSLNGYCSDRSLVLTGPCSNGFLF